MEELRKYIGENYDGSFWKNVTDFYNRDGEAWELRKFEETVEFDGKNYYVIIIEKWNYDSDDNSALDYSEEIFAKYICL